jgi:hypothetical protein
MRLADADVLTMGDGNIPPLEVRLDLQPGDRVGLYEEVRHPSMGAGLSPIEAIVLGSPEPGWFVGETEDGREITFHASNVADVQMGSPQMGGIFDWFKRLAPPVPGSSMIPSEPQQLPTLPAKPEERKGLIAKLKEAFAAPFEPPSREMIQTEKKSMFDFFKKPTTGLPEERAGGEVTRYEKKSSMFSFLSPEATGPLTKFADKAAAIALPDRPGPLAPYIERALAPFTTIMPKSPEPEPFEAKRARQMEMWSGMFEKEPEVKVSHSKMFEMFPKSDIQPYEEVIPPEVPKNLHQSVKVLPMPRRQTLLPSLEEVARGFMGFYNPISELWDTIREARSNPAWQKYLAQYGYAKEPLESLGNCGGPPDIFMELASFMHIPWEEFRNRAEVEEHDEEEEWVNDDLVWMEIVIPAIELITQALDMMRPEDIPGHFIMEKGDDHGCMLIITYVEGEEKEGAREEWEEDQDYQSQAQEDKSPQEIAEELEKGIVEEEETILRLTEELENLAPDNEEFKEISKELKESLAEAKAQLRALTSELSDLPGAEAPRRAPAKKKKPAKRGGKKKGK